MYFDDRISFAQALHEFGVFIFCGICFIWDVNKFLVYSHAALALVPRGVRSLRRKALLGAGLSLPRMQGARTPQATRVMKRGYFIVLKCFG